VLQPQDNQFLMDPRNWDNNMFSLLLAAIFASITAASHFLFLSRGHSTSYWFPQQRGTFLCTSYLLLIILTIT